MQIESLEDWDVDLVSSSNNGRRLYRKVEREEAPAGGVGDEQTGMRKTWLDRSPGKWKQGTCSPGCQGEKKRT